MSNTRKNSKLQIKKLTLRKLTPTEAGDVYGGACCATAGCQTGPCDVTPITKHPEKPGVGWTVGVSITLGPSISGVTLGVSWSYSFTG